MELVLALAIGGLIGSGVWLLLRPRTYQLVIGLSLISYGVNLFIFSMGRLRVGVPPLLGADAALARQWRAVHDAGRPSKLSEKRRHKLRIHAKRLRYAADFYMTLYDGDRAAKRSAALLSATTALQDILGLLNDRAMMKALIAERLPSIARRHLPPPTGRSEAELLAEADEAYRRLRGRKPFWN